MRTAKSLLNYLSTSRRFEGGLIPNLLGYHVLRILFFQLGFHVRKRRAVTNPEAKRIYDVVMREGAAIIPNFFDQETFRQIQEECYNLDLEVYNERAPQMLRGVSRRGEPEHSAVLKRFLGNNEVIKQVVSGLVRKDILVEPGIEFSRTSFAQEDIGAESTETADNLHFDMSFPTIKCFYYINNVDATNGALQYARTSHKMTFARLCMEYTMSVRFWFWSKEKRAAVTPEVSQNFLDANHLQLESIVGGPNTLVIADTMGLHRRGTFNTTEPREIVFVNYRTLDTLRYLKRSILTRFAGHAKVG